MTVHHSICIFQHSIYSTVLVVIDKLKCVFLLAFVLSVYMLPLRLSKNIQ